MLGRNNLGTRIFYIGMGEFISMSDCQTPRLPSAFSDPFVLSLASSSVGLN